MQKNSIFNQRRSGVLLHPTSLPSSYASGDIGHSAYRFVDFLEASGCSIWQMLPLGPTHVDGSPYQCLSVHAGNPLLISLDWLVDKAWLDLKTIDANDDEVKFRFKCLNAAHEVFLKAEDKTWLNKLDAFKSQHKSWLDDYALFMAIKRAHTGKAWNEWPDSLRDRKASALKKAKQEYQNAISQIEFEQFIFFTQWQELRSYANSKHVKLFGDIPIFVSFDSADVWAHRENFLISKSGDAKYVAGVPPDAFSDEGQRWGNPLYDWKYLKKTNFAWWIERFRTQIECFDLMRIDHFRGFEACWQIPADEETAINGEWVKTPGAELLTTLAEAFKQLPLVAEDLGLITEEVHALRKAFSLPGMKVLQFAFDGDPRNIYLPHHHEESAVVYTGTHDNDTTLGWYQNINPVAREYLHDYFGIDQTSYLDMPWALNRMALSSVAQIAIIPMQDLLSLGAEHRMNTPGTTDGNWQWRFEWHQVWPSLTTDLRKLNRIYNRIAD